MSSAASPQPGALPRQQPLHIRLGGLPAASGHLYRVAGQRLLADADILALRPFQVGRGDMPPWSETTPAAAAEVVSRSVEGWLAQARRRVTVTSHAGRDDIGIHGIGEFSVDTVTGDIQAGARQAAVAQSGYEEALLGPPLVFALIRRGVYCLHASAVVRDGRAMLLLGASGAGKSTLAKWLSENGSGRFLRGADDVVPVSMEDGQPVAHLEFPQLKLDAGEQAVGEPWRTVPLTALCAISPVPGGEEPALLSLGCTDLVKALAEQTLASRLFDRPAHAAHLAFLAGMAHTISRARLRYPHRQQALGACLDLLLELA